MKKSKILKIRKNCRHLAKGGLSPFVSKDAPRESIALIHGIKIFRDLNNSFFVLPEHKLIFVSLNEAIDFIENNIEGEV
jgi:hypothetical protein